MAFRKLDRSWVMWPARSRWCVDFNLPMKDGAVTEDTRVRQLRPPFWNWPGKGAKVLLLAHFGRPRGSAALISR
jgi:phosphoglycerate kinase